MQAILLLEDGSVFRGQGHGIPTERVGEVVFNTAMTGYEEVLTDPSYQGQIVVFTASHIGNTGITHDDHESSAMHAEALVCKELSTHADNHRARVSLDAFLIAQGRCALSGVDTRALAQKLRTAGCMMGLLSTCETDLDVLKRRLAAAPGISERALLPSHPGASVASAGSAESTASRESREIHVARAGRAGRRRVAVIDFGMKAGIRDSLVELGCDLHSFSPDASAQAIEAIRPDGLFLSNGAGDPRAIADATPILATLRALAGKIPTFGICMGHQVLGLAFGAEIRKLAFGHHAVNHPVLDIESGTALITSQNHNYVVDLAPAQGPSGTRANHPLKVTHTHLNDGTVAGMAHARLPVFSVQFHPEANPGPRDAHGLFARFVQMMDAHRKEGCTHAAAH